MYRGTSIPDSIDYSPNAIRKFLYVGTLQSGKGLNEIIEAMELLPRLDFEFHLVGDGELYSNLLRKSLLDKRLKVHGHISHEIISEMFLMSDIFVFPSHNEGMPNALIEAASFSRPIIASNINPHLEFFGEKECGWVFKTKNSKNLSEVMAKAIGSSNEELLNYSKESRERAEIDFDFEKNILKIISDLTQITDYKNL